MGCAGVAPSTGVRSVGAAGGGRAVGVKLRTSEKGPAVPAELVPRTRHQCCVVGSVGTVNCDPKTVWSTVNGEVTADFDQLQTGTRINLDTVNGRVNLMIPSDSNATIKSKSA